MQGVEFNISENNSNSITKGSFYKPGNTQYSNPSNHRKLSVKSIKENISEPVDFHDFGKEKPISSTNHQIEFNSGSHPNQAMVPKRGVTLRTGAGVGQKAYSQPSAMGTAKIQSGNGVRMSRAQYAATIAVI